MARIPGVNPETADEATRAVLAAQAKVYGAPLKNHLIYARRPAFHKAARGMWGSLNRDRILEEALVALVNRRVAAHNGCVF